MLKEAVASTLGVEDVGAYDHIPENKTKAGNLGFDLFPNAGETGYDAPQLFRPGKLKASSYDDTIFSGDPTRLVPHLRQIHKLGSGLLAGLVPLGNQAGPMPGMMDAYYAEQTAQDSTDEEDIDPELLMMAGPQAAMGAQFVRRTKKLVDKEKRKTRARSPLSGQLQKVGYRLQGHANFQGLPISIENRRGSVRKGKDADGNEWQTKMKHPYGYITGSKGADGEGVDCYVGPDKEAPDAYVVHQRDKETGKYDEDKVMLGFRSKKEAKEAFLAHYDSPKFLGPIKRVEVDRLRELVASKKRLVKIAEDRERMDRLKHFFMKIRSR